MKPMSKKAQMVCMIPAILVGSAVMIYCIATNKPMDEKLLLYTLAAGIGTFLVLYLSVGKRISAKEAAKEETQAIPAVSNSFAAPAAQQQSNSPAPPISPEKASAKDRVDLRKLLTGEELRILLSDLQVASGKVPPDQKGALDALATEISGTGSIHIKALPVCVSAVETGLGVFSAFGLVPAGHSALLDKLKKLQDAE